MLAVEEPESSRALSICMVMRLKRLGRVSVLRVVLVAAALSSVGREVEDLVAWVSCGRPCADVLDSPAVVCARGMEMRCGAEMVVFCDEVCGLVLALALKSGVVEDDGATRVELSALVDCMFGESVVCVCRYEEVRMLVSGLCSRARSRALSPARARACEWMSESEVYTRESWHKAAFMYVIATRKSEVRQVGSRSSGKAAYCS